MEATTRNRASNHNLRLAFNGGYNSRSDRVRNLKLVYQYGANPKKVKSSPINIPMNVWDNKKREIRKEFVKQYKAYVDWITEFESKRNDLLVELYEDRISYSQAFDRVLNYVKDGVILDSFEKFCISKRKNRKGQLITRASIQKHLKHINALQTFFTESEAHEYSLLKWSHIRISSHHIGAIEKLLETSSIKNETKNRYLESLNYASYVNPNVTDTQPFQDKFSTADDSQTEVDKWLERKHLSEGMLKIKNNGQWLEAYLFWLLSFSLRGVDGADICVMDKSWLVDEKGKKVEAKDIGHYFPDYYKLINRYDIHGDKRLKQYVDKAPKRFNATDKKVYLCGYRTKPTEKTGIRILFNHYPTLIIHRLLKYMVSVNRPHLLYKGDDPMKLYNIDYDTDEGKKEWKNLQNTYTKQLKKMCGDNGKLKHTRHTFTQELHQVFGGNGGDKLLGVSLGHRQKKLIQRYVKVPQYKMDILHIEVVNSYGINRVLKLLLKVCSRYKHKVKGREIPLLDLEGIRPIVTEHEIEALTMPLTIWNWTKEERYTTLLKKESDVIFKDVDENNNPIYEKQEYSEELQTLINERNKFIDEKKVKRKVVDYSRDKGVTISFK